MTGRDAKGDSHLSQGREDPKKKAIRIPTRGLGSGKGLRLFKGYIQLYNLLTQLTTSQLGGARFIIAVSLRVDRS